MLHYNISISFCLQLLSPEEGEAPHASEEESLFELLRGIVSSPGETLDARLSQLPTLTAAMMGLPARADADMTHRHSRLVIKSTLKVLVTTIDAQWEGMGDVGSVRYEPALLPPCPTIRVISYSN